MSILTNIETTIEAMTADKRLLDILKNSNIISGKKFSNETALNINFALICVFTSKAECYISKNNYEKAIDALIARDRAVERFNKIVRDMSGRFASAKLDLIRDYKNARGLDVSSDVNDLMNEDMLKFKTSNNAFNLKLQTSLDIVNPDFLVKFILPNAPKLEGKEIDPYGYKNVFKRFEAVIKYCDIKCKENKIDSLVSAAQNETRRVSVDSDNNFKISSNKNIIGDMIRMPFRYLMDVKDKIARNGPQLKKLDIKRLKMLEKCIAMQVRREDWYNETGYDIGILISPDELVSLIISAYEVYKVMGGNFPTFDRIMDRINMINHFPIELLAFDEFSEFLSNDDRFNDIKYILSGEKVVDKINAREIYNKKYLLAENKNLNLK